MGWLANGIAQFIGTLVGLLIGLLVFVGALYLVLRRFGGARLEPIIRVELSGLPFRAGGVAGSRGDADPNIPLQAEEQLDTAVADFGDACIPVPRSRRTYDEQQRAKAERGKEIEREILKQILEENVALSETITAQTRVA